jgi:energy-converting hydrogenase Eha subunit A
MKKAAFIVATVAALAAIATAPAEARSLHASARFPTATAAVIAAGVATDVYGPYGYYGPVSNGAPVYYSWQPGFRYFW